MATTLIEHETEVANAIRSKKGTTEKINPQNFAREILGLSTAKIEEDMVGLGYDDEFAIFSADEGGICVIDCEIDYSMSDDYGSDDVELAIQGSSGSIPILWNNATNGYLKGTVVIVTADGSSSVWGYREQIEGSDQYYRVVGSLSGRVDAYLYAPSDVSSANATISYHRIKV